MGATIARLEAAGLAAGFSDPNDGRQTLWSLTEEGESWLQTVRPAFWVAKALEIELEP